VRAIVAPEEHVTVSSGRAHVHGLPMEDLDPYPRASAAAVRELLGARRPGDIIVAPGSSARDVAAVLPRGATVVICGAFHRFIETDEQCLARELTKRGFDVVFLPRGDEPRRQEPSPGPATLVL
jgi:hypothetical protein